MVKSLKDSKVQVQELEKSLADARVRVHELEGSPPNQWSIPEPLASVSRPDSAPGVGDKEEDSVSARVDAVERTIEKEVRPRQQCHRESGHHNEIRRLARSPFDLRKLKMGK